MPSKHAYANAPFRTTASLPSFRRSTSPLLLTPDRTASTPRGALLASPPVRIPRGAVIPTSE